MITLEHAPVPDHELTLQIAHRVIDAHAAELELATKLGGSAPSPERRGAYSASGDVRER